jgi:hypothetical protein
MIVNGTEVRPHRYPWIAVMLRNGDNVCGGSIITDRLILTAGNLI